MDHGYKSMYQSECFENPKTMSILRFKWAFPNTSTASNFLRHIFFQNYKLFSLILLSEVWRNYFCSIKKPTELFSIFMQLYSILQYKILLRNLWILIYTEKLRTDYRLHHFYLHQRFYQANRSIYHRNNTYTNLQMER